MAPAKVLHAMPAQCKYDEKNHIEMLHYNLVTCWYCLINNDVHHPFFISFTHSASDEVQNFV